MDNYILTAGVIDETFYKDFIVHHIQKNLQAKCNKIINDSEFIECYSIGIKSDRQCSYSELWLLDINLNINNKNYYLPIFIEDINTSSEYAMSRSYLDNDEEVSKSLDEILNMCPESTRSQLKNILS